MTRHRTAPPRAPPARHGRWPHEAAPRQRLPPRSRRQQAPEYAVVISASDWVKEHFPAAGANLRDALNTGHDRHRDPEPDLEAEP